MARLIDKDALGIGKANRDVFDVPEYADGWNSAVAIIEDAPTVDAVEVVHGKWHKRGNEKACSVCDFVYYSNNDEWNYCPNCGAKMDGKESK